MRYNRLEKVETYVRANAAESAVFVLSAPVTDFLECRNAAHYIRNAVHNISILEKAPSSSMPNMYCIVAFGLAGIAFILGALQIRSPFCLST